MTALLGLLLLATGTLPLSGAAVSPALKTCLASGDAARGVNAAMKACTQAELQRRDQDLNRMYKKNMARLSAAARNRLRQTQRDWIKRRDANCEPNLSPEAGSLGSLDYLDCMIDETIKQTRRLARMR
jgi:uncharacterized protein YecT (DUF1311 family)